MQGSFLSLAGLSSKVKNSWVWVIHPSWLQAAQPGQDLLGTRRSENSPAVPWLREGLPAAAHLHSPLPSAFHMTAAVFKVRLKDMGPHIEPATHALELQGTQEKRRASRLPGPGPQGTAWTVWRTRPSFLCRTQANPEAPEKPTSPKEWRRSKGKYSLLVKRARFQDKTPAFWGVSKRLLLVATGQQLYQFVLKQTCNLGGENVCYQRSLHFVKGVFT